ncbi:hypothetical protein HHI36_002600 [Cryptolaemus montrouzieri]|uniref:Uncharacterized protein n=1 Tax=Cryptolaemus montrouzieri TaxID=559131 RepID=A0ABD2PBK1_9CUCU
MKSFICTWIIKICLAIFLPSAAGDISNIFSVVKQYERNSSEVTLNEDASTEVSNISIYNNHSYILKIHFTLNENTIVPYLGDLIFKNHDMLDITTEDLIDVSKLEEYGFDESLQLLNKLNVSSDVISVDNFKRLLEISNMTFNDFYEKLKNVINLPMQDALQILKINLSDFSNALAFGNQDAVFEALREGEYTREKFEEAAQKVGTDLPTFYINVKKIILNQMKTNNISHFVEELKDFPNLDKKFYDNVVMVLNLSTADVYRVVNLRKILDNIHNRLNENITLGVVTDIHEITMHKKIYNILEPVKAIVNIYAESILNPSQIYDNLILTKKQAENAVILWSNETIEQTIHLGTVDKNIANCSYFTIDNNQLVDNPVTIVNMSTCCVIVATEKDTIFNLGNPLICDEKLIGLASTSNKDKNLLAFDTLYHKLEENPNSGAENIKQFFTVYPHLMMLLLVILLY